MTASRVLHYDIVRPLGRGGMGEVVEALDTRLGRHVAIKFVAPELAADPAHLRRFEREARAAAALAHPNIAVVHAFETAADRPFLVMELLTGRTLRALLAEGPLPVPVALRVARETASALAYAHGHGGIVHRDVKPENVMFDSHGAAKLTDFGLAHAASATRLTATGAALGTASYMAPESIQGASEASSDVFALGVMLHEMLTGELPFAGEGALATMYAIANQPPRELLAARPEAGEEVAALVARMLEKSPAARPGAEEVRGALDGLLGQASAAMPLPLPPSGPVIPASPEARTLELEAERARLAGLERRLPVRRRRLGTGLSLVLVLAVSITTTMALSRRNAQRRDEAQRSSDRGMLALSRGQTDAAEREFRAAEKRYATLGTAQLGLALVEYERGDASAAAQRLHRLLNAVRGGSATERSLRMAAHSHLAEFAIGDGNWDDAASQLRAALAQDSSDAGVYNQLGFVLLRADRATEASGVLDRGIARFPTSTPLHKNRGLTALALGDTATARRAAEAALSADPKYAPAWALLSRVLAREHAFGLAALALGRYTAAGPADSLELAETVRDLETQGLEVRMLNGMPLVVLPAPRSRR